MEITLTFFLLTIASTHIKTVISEHTPCIILEGVCYRCINVKINGSEYDQKCTESRRTFAKFNSSNVLLSVITKCSGKAGTLHWIAARRFNEKKEFVWIADKTPVDSDYWAERFPIPTNGDCVGLDVKSMKLKNFRCHYKYPYICSYGAHSNIDEVSGESQSKPFHFYLQAFSIMGIIILIIGTGIYWRKGDELHKKPKSRKSVQHKPIRLSQGKHPKKINNILSTEHLESGPPSNTDFIITFPADADNAGPSNQEVYTSVDYEDGVLKVKAPDVITVTKKPVKRKGRIKSGFKKGLLSKGQKLKRLKATVKVEENVPAIVQEENPENFPENVAENVPENVPVKVPENVKDKSLLNVQDKNQLKNPENVPNKVQLNSDTSQVKVVPENVPNKVPLNVPEKSQAKTPESVADKSQLNIQEKAQEKVPETVPDKFQFNVQEKVKKKVPEYVPDKVPKDKSQIS